MSRNHLWGDLALGTAFQEEKIVSLEAGARNRKKTGQQESAVGMRFGDRTEVSALK